MAQIVTPMTALVRIVAGAGVAALALAAAPLSADVKAGVDAWSAGNYSAAVAEWREPANAGDPDALFNLAQAYRLGRGVTADISRARELYAQAANKGHIKAADNYGLLLFQQGEQASAMPLIKDAAERGDPRAQYVLGLAHFNADYAEKDWVRAYALLTLANGAGLPQASNALSQMDQYVPLRDRQMAQSLARQLEAQAEQRRSAELAAIDLGTQQTSAIQSAPAAPIRNAAISQPARANQPRQVAPVPAGSGSSSSITSVSTAFAPQQPGVRPRGNWRVQLGAFGVASNADRLWARLESNPALAGTEKSLVPAGRVTRLQAVGFANRAQAQLACDTLKQQGQPCLVQRP